MTVKGQDMTQAQQELGPDEASKDAFFQRVAEISEEMVAAHVKDFAMGTLVLAARWIASDKVSAAPAPH